MNDASKEGQWTFVVDSFGRITNIYNYYDIDGVQNALKRAPPGAWVMHLSKENNQYKIFKDKQFQIPSTQARRNFVESIVFAVNSTLTITDGLSASLGGVTQISLLDLKTQTLDTRLNLTLNQP